MHERVFDPQETFINQWSPNLQQHNKMLPINSEMEVKSTQACALRLGDKGQHKSAKTPINKTLFSIAQLRQSDFYKNIFVKRKRNNKEGI